MNMGCDWRAEEHTTMEPAFATTALRDLSPAMGLRFMNALTTLMGIVRFTRKYRLQMYAPLAELCGTS
jgi:hypothetical protein